MTLFDFNASELSLNQNGKLSKRQQLKLRNFALRKLPFDIGKVFLLVGIFVFVVFFAPISDVTRIILFLVLVGVVLGLPMFSFARCTQAIKNHSIGYLMSVIRPARTYQTPCVVRVARRSFHPKLVKSELSKLKGFYLVYFLDGLDYIVSIQYLGDESFENRKSHLASPEFIKYSEHKLESMFGFTQEELHLNEMGLMSDRQKRMAKQYTLESILLFPLSIGTMYGALFYFVADGTLFSDLFFGVASLLLTCIWLYLVRSAIKAYYAARIDVVEGTVSLVSQTGLGPGKIAKVYMKVQGIRFAPRRALQSFPDPTGRYRFHYLAGLNYVLAVEFVGPDKSVTFHV